MSTNPFVRRVLAFAVVSGAIAALAVGLHSGLRAGFSSAAGTAIGVLNLWALARLVALLLDADAAGGRRARAAVLLSVKGLALFGVVAALLVTGSVDGLALTAGLSAAALSIVLAAALPTRPQD